MNRLALVVIPLALLAACNKGGAGGASSAKPETEEQKTLYALGRALGRNIQVFDLTEQEVEFVKAGLGDQVLNKQSDVTLEAYGPKLQELAKARSGKRSEKEKVAGTAFAAKAAAEPGAEKLPSGVIVKVTQQGTGEQPAATDQVKVHYEGTLENGTVFDSSKKRGQPATFGLNQVIRCWTEGVQKLKVGGKALLTCPPDTAYGDRGAPPNIPGGATLRFEVELLGIEKGAPGGALPPGHPPTGGMSVAPKGAAPKTAPAAGGATKK